MIRCTEMALNMFRTRLENLKVLGLEAGVTQAEIKQAYKKLALKHHPDKNPDDPEATARFQELSKAYLALKPHIKERPTHRHRFYCPTHGYWSYSDSDYSDYEDDDDDECYSDDECLEEEEGDLLYFFRKVFLDVFSEFVFRNRFFARKKRHKLSPEDEEEDHFFDFIHKKYREQNEDEYELTEEDLRKFHSYDEWHKASSQKKRRSRRKGRAVKRRNDAMQQESTKPVSKKQQLAQQRKREQEMKKIGEELAKSVKTKTTMTNRKQNEAQRSGCISMDEQVTEELKAQEERKRIEQERMKEKLKLIDAEEKKKEKQNKRKEKKTQRKQNKLTSLQKKPGEENQPEENIFLERLKELHQSSHDIIGNRMVSENLKKASAKNAKELNAKSSLLARHFGVQSSDPVHKPSPSPSPTDSTSSTTSTSSVEQTQKPSSELLKRHMAMYEEMMKVQPQRHTEQQIKAERTKEREKMLQKQQEELERLRGEQRSQFTKTATTTSSNADSEFDDPASFQAKRSNFLEQQRQLEKKRNEEEDYVVKTQRLYELKRKKPEQKWYEKERPQMPNNPKKRTSPEVWIPPPTPPKETIWAKRQQEQEQRQAVLEELLPSSELEEQEMLRRALAISEREAREEEAKKKHAKEMSAKLARSYEPSYNPGSDHLPAHTCTMSNSQRPGAQQQYSSIWDIDDKKAKQKPVETAPLPARNIPQPRGPPSYANIARQTSQPAPPPVPYPRYSQTVNEKQPARDTQMDLEREEINSYTSMNQQWKESDNFWNSEMTEKAEHYSEKSMPACVQQTAETAFSVTDSSASSYYSSEESLDEVEAVTLQKNPPKTEEMTTSVTKQNAAKNISIKPERGNNRHENDLLESELNKAKIKSSESEINVDQNNNVFQSNISSEARNDNSSVGFRASMPLNDKKNLSKGQGLSKDESVFKQSKHGGFGKPLNQRNTHKEISGSVQKQNKPVDNISSTNKPSDFNWSSLARKDTKAVESDKTVSRGGFGRPKLEADKSKQAQSVTRTVVSDQENVKQKHENLPPKSLTPESENWDAEIEDFPDNVMQTYSYGVDHVNFPVKKNRVISEKELVATHKKELHFKKTETVPEKIDLDITPVDGPGYSSVQMTPDHNSNYAKSVSEPIKRDSEQNIAKSEQNLAKPTGGQVESGRRLPVLKDLTKSPVHKNQFHTSLSNKKSSNVEMQRNDKVFQKPYTNNEAVLSAKMVDKSDEGVKKDGGAELHTHTLIHAENEDRNVAEKQRNHISKYSTETNDYCKSKANVQEQKVSVLDKGHPVQQEEHKPSVVVTERHVSAPYAPATQAKQSVTTTQAETNPSIKVETKVTTTQASDKSVPTGLPPHLMQAYLQYLAQTGSGDASVGQNSGLLGGLLPGLGVGMPMMSPFANPLYSPFAPFAMNPLMMNPLLGLSMQPQQQQQSGRQVIPDQNKTSLKTDQVEVENKSEIEHKSENIVGIDSADIHENNAVSHNVKPDDKNKGSAMENIVPLFRNLEIQAQKAVREQPALENLEMKQDQKVLTALPQADLQEVQSQKQSSTNLNVTRPKSTSEISGNNLPNEAECVRFRRPNKEQTASLRIPREPSVSSRLYGVQSSPVEDDPAVVRMSSAEISNVHTWVDDNIKQIRSATLDEDPSIVRFEQKSSGILSPELVNNVAQNVNFHSLAGGTTGNSNLNTMKGWMGKGPNIMRVVENSPNERGQPSSSVDKQLNLPHFVSAFNQYSAKRMDTETIPPQGFPSSQIYHESLNSASGKMGDTNLPVKGRGGFGTPSNPRKPVTAGETHAGTDNPAQNFSRPEFNTKSLSERFGGIRRVGGDGFSARKLPPRLQAQREKNQQVKDMINQLKKDTEASQQAPVNSRLNQRSY